MVDVVLDGTKRGLQFSSRAIGELEVRSGQHIGWFLNELLVEWRCGFGVSIWLLWAGLQHEPRPPRREDIEAAIDRHLKAGGTPADFTVPLVLALREFLPLLRETASEGGTMPEAGSPSPTSGTRNG